jgi:type 1 fimbria pilin
MVEISLRAVSISSRVSVVSLSTASLDSFNPVVEIGAKTKSRISIIYCRQVSTNRAKITFDGDDASFESLGLGVVQVIVVGYHNRHNGNTCLYSHMKRTFLKR